MLNSVNKILQDMKKFVNRLTNMKNKDKIFLVILIVVCSLVLHYVFNKTGILTNLLGSVRLLNPMRLMENQSNPKTLLLLKMDGCGHCEELQPHWDDAVAANTTGITMKQLERGTLKGTAACEQYDVKGFPTMIYDGQKTTEPGRTTPEILNFLKSKHT